MSEWLLTERDILARLKVSRSTFWRMRKRREFPEPLEISAGCKRWSEETYAEYSRPGLGPAMRRMIR